MEGINGKKVLSDYRDTKEANRQKMNGVIEKCKSCGSGKCSCKGKSIKKALEKMKK
jgi:hypothetical protein